MSSSDTSPTTAKKPRGQLKLLAIFAVVIGPIVIAGIMAKVGYEPQSNTNRSDLVEPQIQLEDWQLVADPVGYGSPWRVLVTSPQACEEACLQLLHEARQINVALGREAGRVKHMLALATQPPAELLEQLESEYPRLEKGTLDSAAYQNSLNQHPQEWQQGPQLWVVDPLGRVVLHQDADKPGKQLLDDLKHLLKVSKVG
ncbi:hypothetical protein [Halopseudomonas pelagia]|uniref:Cytochrome oxidase Cu insertion factor, SCO1/SenC/PrrC family n=1 Tax=Halopseudomonas pelagia TaxID=553151 RepID=A0AA91U4J6_9GAMM|nr:hypothetical protein [Halopseudomonas pelagia]PCD00380.1 hypothetical protein CO192_04105 [Halopseudomonas pelagia]QFY55083.1 hypothetical protein EAO82_01070 [Halopseudomonas pelagia]